MMLTANSTLRASPKRVLRIGRFVFAIVPPQLPAPAPKRRRALLRLAKAVPPYLHRDVGLPPAAKPSRMPPDVMAGLMM